jgi:hypothetical protein
VNVKNEYDDQKNLKKIKQRKFGQKNLIAPILNRFINEE